MHDANATVNGIAPGAEVLGSPFMVDRDPGLSEVRVLSAPSFHHALLAPGFTGALRFLRIGTKDVEGVQRRSLFVRVQRPPADE